MEQGIRRLRKERAEMNNIINRDLARIEKNIITLKNRTAENMIQLGQELLKAKEKVPHGEWGEWLREKVDFSKRSANQLMRIAKAFGANSQSDFQFGNNKGRITIRCTRGQERIIY